MPDTGDLLSRVQALLHDFETQIGSTDIRVKVLALVPVVDQVRELGKSIIPSGLQMSARERLLAYFRRYAGFILNEKELALVAGISEWARRVRELRVELGWPILSGLTVAELRFDGEAAVDLPDCENMGPDDYVLIEDSNDRDAAYRWNIANQIRRERSSMKEKLLKFLRANVGKTVTGEELRYVARGSEWARRIRELRTEEGWPVVTRMTGRPDLKVGTYVLEMDRQSPTHDRSIPDAVLSHVLERDEYRCRKCGWNHDKWHRADPRFLELHHIRPHVQGGDSSAENLITYCNVCHDAVHRVDARDQTSV